MTDISATNAGTLTIGDLTVNRLGLGTNRLTDIEAGHALLKRALELDINFIDTAHVYANGASETTLGNTLAPFKPGLLIATKGGMGAGGMTNDPAELRNQLETSLERLHTSCINVYQLHRVDPAVPLSDTIRLLKQFQDEGKIKHIGLSEVSVDQLQEALTITPIVSVQNEYNVSVRKHEDLVDFCTEHGIVFIPWFPLGGLSGDGPQAVQDKLANLTDKYNATAYQLALAWLLKRSPVMLPIPGTLSIDHLESNLQATTIQLTDADYESLL